jgi:hypothetical protein
MGRTFFLLCGPRFPHAAEFLCSVAAILILTAATPAAAQTITAPSKNAAQSYYGLTQAQIEMRFGGPDRKLEKSGGGSEWSYGNSVFFFTEGKVNAWSDGGELRQREDENALRQEPSRHDDALSGEWENPWTPGKKKQPDLAGIDFLTQ